MLPDECVRPILGNFGGFSLGLERAGMRTVAFCEIEEYPRKVLAKHWPGVPIHKDIRKLNGEQYRGTVNVVCGGFPCQPFSLAGQRRGKADDRDLWPEMFRVIREVQPTWVIGENVAGFVNMELDRTLADLESEGYACQTFDIPAIGVDAPHIRHRVWVVAHRSGQGSQRRSLGGSDCEADEGEQQGCAVTGSDHAGGYSCHWPVEPAVCRMANGIPRRLDRLRGLGNAVVPQIPEILGRAIMELERDH